jgi:hypothetical protein
MVFDLQLFCGGGSSTTVQSAPQTAEEKRLQGVQANYAEKTAPTALALQSMGSNMILNNPGVVPVDYTQMGNAAVTGAQNLQNQSANLSNVNSSNQAQGLGSYDGLTNTNNYNQAQGTNAYNGLISTQNQLNSNNASTMSPLMNGQLPSAYADNQQYAINRGMNTSMGNMLADKASRGILNSSVTGTGIQGISDSVANALSQNYNTNMAQAAALQNQNATQQQTGQNANYNTNNSLADLRQQGYANQNGITQGMIGLNQQSLDNYSNNINQQNSLLSQPMALANSAQNASIDIPAKLLALSQGQQVDTSNLLNTLSTNRINDKTTTATSSNGGLLSGLLSGVGSYYGAK